MPTIADVAKQLEAFAPVALAEDWDNVGLLVGDSAGVAERVMTCLTLTQGVAAEAIERQANLVVTHHPLPFRPLKRITTDSPAGGILWQLIRAGISVYSPHTALDSAAEGINQQLADGLNLAEAAPLMPVDLSSDGPPLGAGRCGAVLAPTTLGMLVSDACNLLSVNYVRMVGSDDQPVHRVAVACGSGGSFLDAAIEAGADALVTGEATFHTLLDAQAANVAVVLTGHYASERFALENLADWLKSQLPELHVWASTAESDPLRLKLV